MPLLPDPSVGIATATVGLLQDYTLIATIQNPLVLTGGLVVTPDLSENAPIGLGLLLTGTITRAAPTPQPSLYGTVEDELRTLRGVSVSLPTPCIVAGRPTLPQFWARSDSAAVAVRGPAHIHAIADPNPVWDPATSGWSVPPPPVSGGGDARWTVNTLPNPPTNGYYWLGDPSGADGTLGIATGARQWAPDGSTPGAPAWRSFFPYKPSVRAVDAYLPGGDVVHHPKGVHCNSAFIEHMWLDWGADRRQPFTVLMAAMVASYPHPAFVHHLLDAGRNPDTVGFPRIDDSETGTPRSIADGLGYRTALEVTAGSVRIAAAAGGKTVSVRAAAAIRPKMYVALFSGASSMVGAWDTAGRKLARGTVNNGSGQHHRYLVLGRRQNRIAQNDASHVIIFEIRYWHRALSLTELDEQFGQLSSTHKFHQYRAV